MVKRKKSAVYRPVAAEVVLGLASPVRQEIMDCLAAGGPMSVGEVAHELGRKPASLYFHFRRLTEMGLIERAGDRQLQRHNETLYRTPGELRLRLDLTEPGMRGAMAAMGSAMLRVAKRDLANGVTNPRANTRGHGRNLWTARTVAWVTSAELARINELLTELLDTLQTMRTESRSEKISLVWALAPVDGDDTVADKPPSNDDNRKK